MFVPSLKTMLGVPVACGATTTVPPAADVPLPLSVGVPAETCPTGVGDTLGAAVAYGSVYVSVTGAAVETREHDRVRADEQRAGRRERSRRGRDREQDGVVPVAHRDSARTGLNGRDGKETGSDGGRSGGEPGGRRRGGDRRRSWVRERDCRRRSRWARERHAPCRERQRPRASQPSPSSEPSCSRRGRAPSSSLELRLRS